MMRPFTLRDFVEESNRIEGIEGATADQIAAHVVFLAEDRPTIASLARLSAVLQSDARLRDHAGVPGVRVGNHVAPPSGPRIVELLEAVLAAADPWEQHVAYEALHPFTDGNGRSGRALWLHRHGGNAPIGFLHRFYYQTLANLRIEVPA